jgi:hypothetical protein
MDKLEYGEYVGNATMATDIMCCGEGFVRALPNGGAIFYDPYGIPEINEYPDEYPSVCLTYAEMEQAIVNGLVAA